MDISDQKMIKIYIHPPGSRRKSKEASKKVSVRRNEAEGEVGGMIRDTRIEISEI
jgi:hypothetical protein